MTKRNCFGARKTTQTQNRRIFFFEKRIHESASAIHFTLLEFDLAFVVHRARRLLLSLLPLAQHVRDLLGHLILRLIGVNLTLHQRGDEHLLPLLQDGGAIPRDALAVVFEPAAETLAQQIAKVTPAQVHVEGLLPVALDVE